MIATRAAKAATVAAIALFASLVTFGNLTDYGTNLAFERMDAFCDRRRSQIESARSFGDRTVIDRHQKSLKEPRIHCQLKVSSKETIVYF